MSRHRSVRRAQAIWVSSVIIVVLIMLANAALTEQPDGVCTGIGWGCQVSGSDLAILLAIVIVPIALVVLLIGHVLIAAVGAALRRCHNRQHGAAGCIGIETTNEAGAQRQRLGEDVG